MSREHVQVATRFRRLPEQARRALAVGYALRNRLEPAVFLALVGLPRF